MKKHFSKRMIAALLAFAMVLMMVPARSARAAEGTTEQTTSGGKTYTFNPLTDVKLEGADATKDKAAIPAGTTYADGFLKIVGKVTQRYQESKGGVYCVEVDKALKGAFEFTITGTADVSFDASSTGGSNTSPIGLINAETKELVGEKENTTTVTGTKAVTLNYTNLPAGTYQIVSPEMAEYGRGARIMSIQITEYPAVVETKYSFNPLTDVKLEGADATKDKAVIPAGTTYADGFLKIVGKVTQRYQESKGGVYCVEVDKALKGAFEFTVTGTADVSFDASSTGGSNTSPIGLINAETKELVGEKENTTTVTGTKAVTLNYTNLPAGTYQIVSPEMAEYGRGARIMGINITHYSSGSAPAPKDWAEVAAPVIASAKQDGSKIIVLVQAEVGRNGADKLEVTMLDKNNKKLDTQSTANTGTEHTLEFQPDATGTYTFKAVISRADEEPKAAAETKSVEFLLPLGTPAISSATSVGNGGIDVVWSAVAEAEQYEVYVDGVYNATTNDTHYTVKGLKVGTEYSFTVAAVRDGEKSEQSKPVLATATADAQTVWGFTVYGPSTNSSNNGYVGSVNQDGKVTVYSEGGKGKIVPNSTDGVAFYYTAIPTNKNFTLRATVTVNSWTLSNGQEGFGLLATDRLGANGSAVVWNNQYMAMASKVEFNWEGAKYSMKLGIGTIAKTGVTPENLPKLNANDTETINKEFSSVTSPLEHIAADLGKGAGTYNIVGNQTNKDGSTIVELTSFDLEIQKNNTGYFITYYDAEGRIIGQVKNYDPNALSMLDTDNVYVGFFAARNARATFSNIQLTTIDPKDDAPAEEKPVTKVEPSVNITSASTANSENYTAYLHANVSGTATLLVNGTEAAKGLKLTAGERLDVPVKLTKVGDNKLEVVFTPDPNQDLGEDTVLASTDPVKVGRTVTYKINWANQNNLYVSPNGKPTGNGEKEFPLDIYTAVQNVRPGQTIILMEGTYKLDSTVRIEHGIDGTAEKPIRMVADPEAKTRPVLDFQKKVAGIVHGGDHWYFQGFDVTNSANGQKGFQVSGHYNVLDRINTYKNGNSGVQISRYAGSDPKSEWPSNNLILNCTSYENADAGYEDADGFAAKLTCGEGNVFDGCVAYHNADDGWDLYAKVETGSIGAVTIKNCVAYENGYVTGDDGKLIDAGNGNGFKMGGESLSGKHKLINSYAFFNKSKGFDSNSCPDIIVENSTSYNNERNNVAFYTNNAANTDYSATGILSYKDETCRNDGYKEYENLKPKGTQVEGKYVGETNYYWTAEGSKNSAGDTVVADVFRSLDFKGVKRNADGTLDLQGFLELKDQTFHAGAKLGGTASESVTITPDPDLPDPKEDNPKTGDIFMPMLVLAVLSAGGLVLLNKKKEF